MNRRAKSSAGSTQRSRRIVAALAGLALVTVLTSCASEVETVNGSETEPLYGGAVFVSSETISFESGEKMGCYGRDEDMTDGIYCEWEDAPLANIKLSEESAKDWELVFVDLRGNTVVCLTNQFQSSVEVMDCRDSPVLR